MVVENDIEVQKSLEVVYNSTPINRFQAKIPGVIPITDEIIADYHNFQSIINHCNNNAEVLNNRLRDFLLTIKERKQTKEELMAMDFMGLRGIFSNFLNSYTAITKEENFNTKDKRKAITQTFFNYISDRNIYTHGALKLRRPDETFVIQFIANKKIKLYAELRADILKSNLAVSIWLMKILAEINTFYHNIKPLNVTPPELGNHSLQ